MQYQDSPIATIDDMSGAISIIRGSVQILAARWRLEFGPEDVDELERILDAADRVQAYHLKVRADVSVLVREAKRGNDV